MRPAVLDSLQVETGGFHNLNVKGEGNKGSMKKSLNKMGLKGFFSDLFPHAGVQSTIVTFSRKKICLLIRK